MMKEESHTVCNVVMWNDLKGGHFSRDERVKDASRLISWVNFPWLTQFTIHGYNFAHFHLSGLILDMHCTSNGCYPPVYTILITEDIHTTIYDGIGEHVRR